MDKRLTSELPQEILIYCDKTDGSPVKTQGNKINNLSTSTNHKFKMGPPYNDIKKPNG